MIDSTDTAFQALARLSLANDNDMLLERLICIMPRKLDQPWWSAKDAYHVKLWDIYPTCQIAGVCKDDTVLIDGAFGATIHWDKFRKVASARRAITWKCLACQLMIHGGPYLLLIGILLVIMFLNAQSLLASIGTGFDDISAAYTSIDGVYKDMSDDLNNFASDLSSETLSLLPRDVVSDLFSAYPSATSEFQPIESHVSTAVAGVASAVASEATKVVSEIISQVSVLAGDILSATPAIPSSLAKDRKGLRHANGWAIFGEVIGIFLIILAGFVFLSAPFLTRMLYRGKFCE